MPQHGLQHEREYLEGLLNTRFNFLLLIMSGLGAALLHEDDLGSRTSALLLVLGAVAATAMGLIILRTAALLREILTLLGREARHPYRRAAARVAHRSRRNRLHHLRINANVVIEIAVYAIPLVLAAAAVASHSGLFAQPGDGSRPAEPRSPAPED